MPPFGRHRVSRVAGLPAAALLWAQCALGAAILVSQQDDRTLSGVTYYQMVVNNGRNLRSASGFGTAITFNSSEYSFSLTNYNPALMSMINATLDLRRLTSGVSFGDWSVSPDPASPWRPNIVATASSYTFVSVSAPLSLGGSGASYSFALGPDAPVTGYDMTTLFGTDLAANHTIQIAWSQAFSTIACLDGSCGGTAYRRHWEGDPAGRTYNLSVTGSLHTWVEADLTLDGSNPEPATLFTLGGGLAALASFRLARRNSRRAAV